MLKDEFVSVNIEEFYEIEDNANNSFSTDIVVLTEQENALVTKLFSVIKNKDPETLLSLENRIKDMKQLVADIAKFPSLLQRRVIMGESRTQYTLAEALLIHRDGDKILHLPSKATLGKSFLVVKYHLFSSMSHIAQVIKMDEADIKAFQSLTSVILFTLMIEDVYMDLVDDNTIPLDIRRQIAFSLIILWEQRNDQSISDTAPVLKSVWEVRRKLAPAFGTMLGTSELLLISIYLDENWNAFIKSRLSDQDVVQSMEEFLFGLSYEQILKLRTILKERGIAAIGRDEISAFLGEHIKTDMNSDLRDFYMLYTVRRDNARARKRLKVPGPQSTLEDHYVKFILEKNIEKQHNDVHAK